MRDGFRFHPPPVEISPTARWVLCRAFGPTDRPLSCQPDTGLVVDLALRLSVGARIGQRFPYETLERETGHAAARALAMQSLKAEVWTAALVQSARNLAALAARDDIQLVFLKGTALAFSAVSAPGARWVSDIDVLVPKSQVKALVQRLLDKGYEQWTTRDNEHHLPPLTGPDRRVVELHRSLLGVRIGRRLATVETLEEAALLERLHGEPGAIPSRSVLAAHALAHGLAQHGWDPGSYPLARMLADLIDLAPIETATIAPWLERDLTVTEVAAALELAAALRDGDEDVFERPDRPPGQLLRHLFAGLLDPEYERSLRVAYYTHRPSDLPRPLAWAHLLAKSALLTRAQVEMLYGPQRSLARVWMWRLVRPFDLARRLAVYSWSWLASRARRERAA